MCSADDCRGSTVVQVINSTVDDVNVTLNALDTEQMYLIWVRSISATNTQSAAMYLRVKTHRGALAGGIIAALVIVAVFLVVLTIAALSWIIRYIIPCLQLTCNYYAPYP